MRRSEISFRLKEMARTRRRGKGRHGLWKKWGLGVLALACLGWTGCQPKTATSREPLKEELRQKEELSRQIQKLRREVMMLRQAAKGAPVDISNLKKTSAPPEEELQLLQREVFNLARALDPKVEHSPLGGSALSLPVTGTSKALEVVIPEGFVSEGYRLLNSGQTIIKEPRVVFEGTTPIDSAEDILGAVLKGKDDDQEKAVALWDFVRTARQHYYPSQQGSETEDPVKLANVYGYGYCDDAATALAWLATAAGYEARVWDLNGHVVPELFYGGGWHMLDPDEEVYYFDDQGKIASVDWLAAHPETISNLQGGKRAATARLAEYYRTTNDNHLEKADKEIKGPIHRMAFSLRPGEEITISAEPSGKFFSAQYYWSHPPHGMGRWLFDPKLEDGTFQIGANQAENLQAKKGQLALGKADQEGSLSYEFSLPYPMLDGEVTGRVQVAEGAKFSLEFSADGKTWKEVAEIRGPLQGTDWRASLTSCFPSGYGAPLYRCFLRLKIPAGEVNRVRITGYQISFDLKVAPKAGPILQPGPHQVQYRSKGSADDQATVDILTRQTPQAP